MNHSIQNEQSTQQFNRNTPGRSTVQGYPGISGHRANQTQDGGDFGRGINRTGRHSTLMPHSGQTMTSDHPKAIYDSQPIIKGNHTHKSTIIFRDE